MMQGDTGGILPAAPRGTLRVQRGGDPLQDDTSGVRRCTSPVRSDTIMVQSDTIV
jgi:hypothetical protein